MSIFPNVPDVPGVPPVPRDPLGGLSGVALLVADAVAFLSGLLGPQWGIYRNGFPVVIAKNVVEVSIKQDYTIADYPVEGGKFESYDKVTIPFDAHVRFSAGGTILDRQALLGSVRAIAGTLDLFDVVTPEVTYTNVNVTHFDYRRQAQSGVGLISIDVWCRQVRTSAASVFSSTQSPSGSSEANGGTVQTETPTPNQQAVAGGTVQGGFPGGYF